MKRLPITVRLTLVFAAVMAVVLGATGIFVSLRLRADLDKSLTDGLRARADDVAAFVRRAGPSPGRVGDERLTDSDESFVQIIDEDGHVVGHTAQAGAKPLLTQDELREADDDTVMTGPRRLASLDDDHPFRLLATPVEAHDRRFVVLVGGSTEEADEALDSLVRKLLIGGPAALALATLMAFAVARAALRPVEAMRRQAAEISAADPGRRLPVPPTTDELARLGATLNAMLGRLDDALARERAFVSDASHELRTPLAILQAELELAMDDRRSHGELRAAIRSAAEETDRLARIAEDLLVIARSEQGRLPVRPAGVEVDALFATVIERFAGRAREDGARLERDPAHGVRIVADSLRLEQALGNLLDNALRHGARRARLSADARDGHVELHVRDDGPGFPPAFLARAFERFSRGDEARGRGGAGLGLAVVDGIARAHGGRAHAENRPSGGADVWLDLPSSPVASAASSDGARDGRL